MDTISDLLKLATGFGSAGPVIGILLWLYWTERKERVELGNKVLTLSTQSVEAMKDSTRAIEMLAGKLGK